MGLGATASAAAARPIVVSDSSTLHATLALRVTVPSRLHRTPSDFWWHALLAQSSPASAARSRGVTKRSRRPSPISRQSGASRPAAPAARSQARRGRRGVAARAAHRRQEAALRHRAFPRPVRGPDSRRLSGKRSDVLRPCSMFTQRSKPRPGYPVVLEARFYSFRNNNVRCFSRNKEIRTIPSSKFESHSYYEFGSCAGRCYVLDLFPKTPIERSTAPIDEQKIVTVDVPAAFGSQAARVRSPACKPSRRH